ncbi:MAG: hypothetical protein ABI221_01350 [Candidatus Saccharimonadales bacterium]
MSINTAPTSLGIGQTEMLGFELSMAREELGKTMRDSAYNDQAVASQAASYLGLAQQVFFETDQDTRYAFISEFEMRIKCEAELLLGHAVEPLEDIHQRAEVYRHDQVGQLLSAKDKSWMPRAFSLCMLDLLFGNTDVYQSSRNA